VNPAPAPQWLLERLRQIHRNSNGQHKMAANVDGSERILRDGEHNVGMTSYAGTLRRRGWSEQAIYGALRAYVDAGQTELPMSDDELRKISASVCRYNPQTASSTPLSPKTELEPHVVAEITKAAHTDEGFATIVEALGGSGGLRWVPGLGWAAWDGIRWQLGYHGEGECLIRDWLEQAACVLRATGINEDQARAAQLGNERTLTPGLKRLARRRHLWTEAEHWDDQDWLVGLPDGRVIELGSGEFAVRNGRREDLITMALGCEYDESAECPMWLAFLERILPDAEIRAYVQRWVGYLLCGSIGEHAMAILWGPLARNGKSQLVEFIAKLLGDYAHELTLGALLSGSPDAGDKSNLAQLRGKRFAHAAEPSSRRELNESSVKMLTGERWVTAKRMHKDPFQFRQRAKIWVATNHRPGVSDTDEGIWSKLRLIEFPVHIPAQERIPDFAQVMINAGEMPGVLNWALTGYCDWSRNARGLDEPGVIVASTQEYRRHEDTFGAFLQECYVEDPAAPGVACSTLIERCGEWMKENHHDPRDFYTKRINAELTARGHPRKQRRGAMSKLTYVYTGLRGISEVHKPKAKEEVEGH
jgi:putative DNA primase/helicase